MGSASKEGKRFINGQLLKGYIFDYIMPIFRHGDSKIHL